MRRHSCLAACVTNGRRVQGRSVVRGRLVGCLTAIACGLASTATADAPADAVALFDQGIRDMEAGNFEAACPKLAASLARYDDSGTKGALAECYTKIGKLASAWNLWRNLADTAPAEDLKADAAANAKQLEPRVPRYVIKVAASPPSDLTVTVGDKPVANPTLSVALPIDPGPFTVRATAEGREDWTQTYQAVEAQTTTVEIPALTAKAAPPTPPPAVVAPPPVSAQVDTSSPGMFTSRRKLALGVAGAGTASLVVGFILGSKAYDKRDRAHELCPDVEMPCIEALQATELTRSGNRYSIGADVAFGIGAVALIGATWLWLTGAPTDGVTVAPTSNGVSVQGRF